MKLTRKEAFKLSIEKWEMIVAADGEHTKGVCKRFEHLRAECGLCEKYSETKGEKLVCCEKCPIRPKIKDYDKDPDAYEWAGCTQDSHPFYVWDKEKTKKNAQAVLDLIKSKQ